VNQPPVRGQQLFSALVEQYTPALRPEDFAPYAPISRLMNGK
jgi:hypothetical protein